MLILLNLDWSQNTPIKNDGQVRRRFCTCVTGNNSPYQEWWWFLHLSTSFIKAKLERWRNCMKFSIIKATSLTNLSLYSHDVAGNVFSMYYPQWLSLNGSAFTRLLLISIYVLGWWLTKSIQHLEFALEQFIYSQQIPTVQNRPLWLGASTLINLQKSSDSWT